MGLDTQFVPEENERGREATMVDPTVTCMTHNHMCPHSLRGEKSCFFTYVELFIPPHVYTFILLVLETMEFWNEKNH